VEEVLKARQGHIARREKGEAEADQRYGLLEQVTADVLWQTNESLLLIAGRLKAEFPVSLGDALIVACAIQEGAVLLHKDQGPEIPVKPPASG